MWPDYFMVDKHRALSFWRESCIAKVTPSTSTLHAMGSCSPGAMGCFSLIIANSHLQSFLSSFHLLRFSTVIPKFWCSFKLLSIILFISYINNTKYDFAMTISCPSIRCFDGIQLHSLHLSPLLSGSPSWSLPLQFHNWEEIGQRPFGIWLTLHDDPQFHPCS